MQSVEAGKESIAQRIRWQRSNWRLSARRRRVTPAMSARARRSWRGRAQKVTTTLPPGCLPSTCAYASLTCPAPRSRSVRARALAPSFMCALARAPRGPRRRPAFRRPVYAGEARGGQRRVRAGRANACARLPVRLHARAWGACASRDARAGSPCRRARRAQTRERPTSSGECRRPLRRARRAAGLARAGSPCPAAAGAPR